MILIRKGEINKVPLTLTEKLTEYPADFLFKFTNIFNKTTKIFAAQNTSNAQSRYDLFLIEESNTEDLISGKVKLASVGEWDYVVYQMPISSPPSLDVSQAVAILETGKVHVISTSTKRIFK